jgi:hypothetical protein
MQTKVQTTISAGEGAIENANASLKVGGSPQVVEYIRELTAELTRMANSANCRSLSYLLAITSLEAKKLAQKGGCELSGR